MTPDSLPFPARLEALAAFAAAGHRTRLPAEVDAFARVLLLDTLGALVGGTRYPEVRRMRECLGAGDLRGEDLPFAALFRLGAAATWLDADSGGSFHPQGHRLPPVPTAHPAPHVLPVVLQGAARGASDDELVRAFAVATEVGLRFGTATSLRPGMHPHGLHGPVAAAVASSLLRGHSPAQLATAMGQSLRLLAAARLWQPMQGGTVRNAWTGLGAYYGARAAAEAGLRGGLDPTSAGAVLQASVMEDVGDLPGLTAGLGSRWTFLDSYLKPYACARWIHPALDALSGALADGGGEPSSRVAPGDVDHVLVDTFAYAAGLDAVDARSDLHARFSMPLCLATLLRDGELHAAGFLPERLARPEVRELARRITLRENAKFSAALPRERPTTVTVTWRDGRTASCHVRNARGNPADPLSADEVAAKFASNVETVLSEGALERCLDAFLVGRSGAGSALAVVADEVVVGTGAPALRQVWFRTGRSRCG
ncbi:MAG TPA: MmgE/PrpD family protein [Intrasporangium sp.]|uniref:MmgE/PrpD family protein n=1 Tax=Intrasporangium sp. TaxID=1925024 RepID=UPI002D767000|nr:MmgE/PrpD family protein [Intrasporangium sp.]HET7400085.1 MmgE/PrpD family protein [Intrasporangium sp.]